MALSPTRLRADTLPMTRRALHIYTGHERLRLALARALARYFPEGTALARDRDDGPLPGDVVVLGRDHDALTTCRALASRGVRVVIHSTFLRQGDHEAFRAAGAEAYVVMNTDLVALIAAIAAALA